MEHFHLTKKLHTDVLESKYGPIHSEVTHHDMFLREAFLCDQDNVARTYALSFFEQDLFNPEIQEIDNAIKNGGLIGKTFRDYGFEVRKNVTDVFVIELPEQIKNRFQSEDGHAKARLSEFYAKKKEGQPLIYATVMEVYAPDFRPADINEADKEQIHPTTVVLEHAGFNRQEIWDAIEDEKKLDPNDERYIKALHFYNQSKGDYKERFVNYMKINNK